MRAKDIYVLGLHENLDTVYNMLTTVTAVNARNAASYAMQSNGVHPAPTGYYQMADFLLCVLEGPTNEPQKSCSQSLPLPALQQLPQSLLCSTYRHPVRR